MPNAAGVKPNWELADESEAVKKQNSVLKDATVFRRAKGNGRCR